MTGDRSHRTLKDQLEFVIADMERQVAEDLDTLYGGDWCQLTDEEESVFRINPDRFPRMIMTWHCYEVFKRIAIRDLRRRADRAGPPASPGMVRQGHIAR